MKRTPVTRPLILIVDDDDDLRLGLSIRIRSAGFATSEAATVSEAREAMDRDQPDLVLLDLGIPGGGGISVLESLSAGDSRIPVIVLTGSDHPDWKRRALSMGIVAYLEKPVENRTLLETIRRSVGPAAASG